MTHTGTQRLTQCHTYKHARSRTHRVDKYTPTHTLRNCISSHSTFRLDPMLNHLTCTSCNKPLFSLFILLSPRIHEASPNSLGVGPNTDGDNNNDDEDDDDEDSDKDTHTLVEDISGATVSQPQSQRPIDTSDEPRRAGPGLRRGSDSRPERYLHQIIH